MKVKITSLAVFFTILCSSAQSIVPYFTSVPNQLLPYLSDVNRKDLIDLFKNGKPAKVENLFKGESEIKVLKNDFLKLQLNSSAILEMKLLPINGSGNVIVFINTITEKATDSQIAFYSTQWAKIKAENLLPNLTIDDFVIKERLKEAADPTLIRYLDVLFISYAFDQENNDLTATLDAKSYLNKENFKLIEPLLRKNVLLKWENNRFVKHVID